MSQLSFAIQDFEDWQRAAQTLVNQHWQGPRLFVMLEGTLGAGKTTFVQYVAQVMKARSQVTSPTYDFLHEHDLPESPHRLVHLDLYRLEHADGLLELGFWDLFLSKHLWVFVEWWSQVGAQARLELPEAWPVWQLVIRSNSVGRILEAQRL